MANIFQTAFLNEFSTKKVLYFDSDFTEICYYEYQLAIVL